MRVVIDTNVIIAALYSRNGASYEILTAAISKKLDYAISPLVALEYIGKIEDKTADGLLTIPIDDSLALMKTVLDNGYKVSKPVLYRPTLPDNADDKILECAIAAACQSILTFNIKDFPQKILRRHGLVAMTPGEFMRRRGDGV